MEGERGPITINESEPDVLDPTSDHKDPEFNIEDTDSDNRTSASPNCEIHDKNTSVRNDPSPRRPSRARCLPAHLKDYVMN